jgi:DNA-binding Lrp family transcriptional regulator
MPTFIRVLPRKVFDETMVQDNAGIAQFSCCFSAILAILWHLLLLEALLAAEYSMNIDRFDKSILAALQKDGRISNVQLAGSVNLSESACLRRVRALEDAGLIERYVALLNQKAIGLSGTVFVHIALRREEQSELAAFEKAVRDIPEIMECYLMTGEFDYLLRVVVSDMADFERLHNEALTRLPGVSRVNSSVAIRTVTKTTELPL